MFNSARTNGYILTTSRSSADDYLILSWTEEVIVTTLETFPKKAESGKVDQTRLDVWLALRDSTGKVFGNLLVSTFTTILLLTSIFGTSCGRALSADETEIAADETEIALNALKQAQCLEQP